MSRIRKEPTNQEGSVVFRPENAHILYLFNCYILGDCDCIRRERNFSKKRLNCMTGI